MKRLLNALGADYTQWRALSRAYALIDFAALRGAYGRGESRRAARAAAVLAVFFALVGAWPAFVIWVSPDFLAAATVMTTTVGWLTFTLALFQVSTLVAPFDYEIVGFRPVDSRTYLVARVTAVLNQVGSVVVLAGCLPVAAFVLRPGGSWRLGLAAALAVVGSAAAVILALVTLHAGLARVMRPTRLTAAITVGQAFAMLAAVGAFVLVMAPLVVDAAPSATAFAGLALSNRPAWLLWYPGAWFAAYVELARGSAGAAEWIAAVASVGVLGSLVALILSGLSAGYSASVAIVTMQSTAGTMKAGRTFAWPRGERRAVAILLWNHLRRDMQFQLGFVASALTVVAIAAVALYGSRPADPFAAGGQGDNEFALCLALLVLGNFVHQMVTMSAGCEASWPLFTTPADRVRLVTAGRDVMAVFVLLPAMFVTGGLLTWFFSDLGHAVLLTLFLGGTSYIILQIATLLDPAIPLSVPQTTTARGGPLVSWLTAGNIVGLVFGTFLFLTLERVAYQTPLRIAIGMFAIVVVVDVLNRLTRARVRAVSAKFECQCGKVGGG